jgi:NAD(P)-dependent dehydrogenase (short-subunit alcohol dehydrogenase family)
LSNKLHFIECDLLSISSIHGAANQIQELTNSIDVLVNNAGWWASNTFETSSDGIESTFAVKQVAPFLLTGRLLPLLSKSKQARIINTASFRYEDAKIDPNDLQLKKNFNAEQAYCNSKFYSVLFTQRLAEKLVGTGITVNCFDPGIVDTPMLQKALPVWLSPFYFLVRRLWHARQIKVLKQACTYVSLTVLALLQDLIIKISLFRKPRDPLSIRH